LTTASAGSQVSGLHDCFDTERHNGKVVNFEKMRKQTHVIKDIILYQQNPYNFVQETTIRTFFTDILKSQFACLSETENFKKSREIEPKSMIDNKSYYRKDSVGKKFKDSVKKLVQ